MGNCLWGARRLRRVRIRDQKRKIEQKQYLQELEIDKYREEEASAKQKLVKLAEDDENPSEVYALAGEVMAAQDKQVRGHGVLELLHAVGDRIDVAQQTEEMRTVVLNSASAAFRVHAMHPPSREAAQQQMAQAVHVLRAAPTQPAALPALPAARDERRGRILINRRDKLILNAKHAARGDDSSGSRSGDDDSDGDADLQRRLERLRDED